MTDRVILDALVGGFHGGYSHMSLEDAVAEFPPEHYNTKPRNVPYSFWHLLEHIRITGNDLLTYSEAEQYVEGEWPGDYWPDRDATADEAAWQATIAGIQAIDARFEEIAGSSLEALAAKARHAGERTDHTMIRSLRIALQHESYHLGEFAILRQVEDLWPPDHT
jgi:hypothetical protein